MFAGIGAADSKDESENRHFWRLRYQFATGIVSKIEYKMRDIQDQQIAKYFYLGGARPSKKPSQIVAMSLNYIYILIFYV